MSKPIPRTKSWFLSPGLLRTSTSSPSSIFETLSLVPYVVTDFLVNQRPSWLVSEKLGYKGRVTGRKQGFRKSRTAGTSTSCGVLLVTSISYTTELMIPFSQIKPNSIRWSVKWTKPMLLKWSDRLHEENMIEKNFRVCTKNQFLFQVI